MKTIKSLLLLALMLFGVAGAAWADRAPQKFTGPVDIYDLRDGDTLASGFSLTYGHGQQEIIRFVAGRYSIDGTPQAYPGGADLKGDPELQSLIFTASNILMYFGEERTDTIAPMVDMSTPGNAWVVSDFNKGTEGVTMKISGIYIAPDPTVPALDETTGNWNFLMPGSNKLVHVQYTYPREMGNYVVYSTGVDQSKWYTLDNYTQGTVTGEFQYSENIDLPFEFEYNGVAYTQWAYNTDAEIMLGMRYPTDMYRPDNDSSLAIVLMGGFHGKIDGNSYVRWQTFGTAPNRVFVIEYHFRHFYEEGVYYNMQAQLAENGSITIVYGNANASQMDFSFWCGLSHTGSVYNESDYNFNEPKNAYYYINRTDHSYLYNERSSKSDWSWPGQYRWYTFSQTFDKCKMVDSLTYTVTPTNITLQWQDNDNAAGVSYNVVCFYETIRLDPQTHEPVFDYYNGGYVHDTVWVTEQTGDVFTSTSATFDNLNPNTNYTVIVRSQCSATNLSEAIKLTVKTPCFPVATAELPYLMRFNEDEWDGEKDYDKTPRCWDKLFQARAGETLSSHVSEFIRKANNYNTGNRYLHMEITPNPIASIAILPAFDTALSALSVSFLAEVESDVAANAKLEVGYITDIDDTATFTAVETFTTANGLVASEGFDNAMINPGEINVEFRGVTADARMAIRLSCIDPNSWMFPRVHIDSVAVEIAYNVDVTVNNDDFGTAAYTKKQLVAMPDSAHYLVRWENAHGTLVGTDNPQAVTVTSDTAFVAVFAAKPVLTLAHNNGGEMEIMPAGGVTATHITSDQIPTWQGSYDPVMEADLQPFGFVAVDSAAARTWTDAPALGDILLLYAPAGDQFKGHLFRNGQWYDAYTVEFYKADFYTYSDNVYFTTGVSKGNVIASATPNTYYVDYNTDVTVVATPDATHYLKNFVGGADTNSNIAVNNTFTVTADTTLTANFQAKPVLTLSQTEGGVTTIAGSSVSATLLTNEMVSGWNGDNTLVTPADLPGFQAVDADLAATWTGASPNGYTFLLYGFSPEDSLVNYAIFYNGSSEGSFASDGRRNGVDYMRQGYNIYYSTGITFPQGILATETPNAYAVDYDSTVVVVAKPDQHYHLTSWSNNYIINATLTDTLRVNNNATLTASFAKNAPELAWTYHGIPVANGTAISAYHGFEADTIDYIDTLVNEEFTYARYKEDASLRYGSTNPAVVSYDENGNYTINGAGTTTLYMVHDGSLMAYDSAYITFTLLAPDTLTLVNNEGGNMTVEMNGGSSNAVWGDGTSNFKPETPYTADGITLTTSGFIFSDGQWYDGPFTFTSTEGNFSRIEITISNNDRDWGNGWTINGDIAVWEGDASEVRIADCTTYVKQITFVRGGGSGSADSLRAISENTYAAVPGATATVTATPDSVHYLVRFDNDDAINSNIAATKTYTVSGNTTATANFSLKPTITLAQNEGGVFEAVVQAGGVTATHITSDQIPTWQGSYDPVMEADLQPFGFVAVDSAAARTWTDAPALGDAYLIYDFTGDYYKAHLFRDGQWADWVNDYFYKGNFYLFANLTYFTTGTIAASGVVATTEPNKYYVDYGTDVTVVATPDATHYLVRFDSDADTNSNTAVEKTYTGIIANTTATATFNAKPTITLAANDTAWGTVAVMGETTTLPGGSQETTVTFTASEFADVMGAAYQLTKGDITVSVSNGACSTAYDYIRIYKDADFTVSSSTGNIKSISFTCTAMNTNKYGPGGFGETAGYEYDKYNGSWMGNAASMTLNASENQVCITNITVVYDSTYGGTTTVFPDGVAQIDATTYRVDYGTEVTVIAHATELHHVANWENQNGDNLHTATYTDYFITEPVELFPSYSSLTITLTGDTMVRAMFGINSYDVVATTTLDDRMGGAPLLMGTVEATYFDIEGAEQSIAADTNLTLTAQGGSTTTLVAKAEYGYVFKHWTAGNGIYLSDTLRVSEATDAKAVFVPDTFTVTLAANDSLMGFAVIAGMDASTDGTYAIAYLSEMNIMAVPASRCFDFAAWSNIAETTAVSIQTVTLTGDTSITATFVRHDFPGDTTASECDLFAWHDSTYTLTPAEAPAYLYLTPDGCDSTVTLHLTVRHSNTGVETATACDQYEWQGTVYTKSDTLDQRTLTNIEGCDSVVTLNLTVNYHHDTTVYWQTSGDFVWGRGTSYEETFVENGTYNRTIDTKQGCDSNVTIVLAYLPHTTPLPTIYNIMGVSLFINHFPEGTDKIDYIYYRWYKNGEVVSEGEGVDSYSEDGDMLNGCFYLEISTEPTLTYWAQSNEVCLGNVGIDDVKDITMTLAPNPVVRGQQVNVTVSESNLQGAVATVYDAQGRQVSNFEVRNSTFEIQTSNLTAGIYTVRIVLSDGRMATKKVVVK